ncbi:MAG: zinc-dependent dehydrogenase [Thermoplasmata archaeon]|nr:zinc-dependent dehydrogenase [Thermoplasmata archaeon]
MRVAVYYSNSDVRVEEIQKPEIGPKEIMVKVMASGICGSDVMEWYRVKTAPRVLGHEIAGKVVEVGSEVTKFKIRDRVFVSHHVPCDSCSHCLLGNHTVCEQLRSTNFDPGGFSEYVRVPEVNLNNGVFILPDNMSYPVGTFIEPLACVVRGQRQANMREGQTVLVIGSGISGLLHIKLALAKGAKRVIATDVLESRLEMARQMGAEVALDARGDIPKSVRSWNRGELADLVIICAGSLSAIKQGLASVNSGGTILLFAPSQPGKEISIEPWEFWKNGKSLVTTYAAAPEDILEAIDLLDNNIVQVRDMITHKLPLRDAQRGFQLMSEANDSMKIIIEPHK